MKSAKMCDICNEEYFTSGGDEHIGCTGSPESAKEKRKSKKGKVKKITKKSESPIENEFNSDDIEVKK